MVFQQMQVCRAEQHQRQLGIRRSDGTISPLRLEEGQAAVLNFGGSLVVTQQQLATLTLDEYRHIAGVGIALLTFKLI